MTGKFFVSGIPYIKEDQAFLLKGMWSPMGNGVKKTNLKLEMLEKKVVANWIGDDDFEITIESIDPSDVTMEPVPLKKLTVNGSLPGNSDFFSTKIPLSGEFEMRNSIYRVGSKSKAADATKSNPLSYITILPFFLQINGVIKKNNRDFYLGYSLG